MGRLRYSKCASSSLNDEVACFLFNYMHEKRIRQVQNVQKKQAIASIEDIIRHCD
jgi:hypothetical protein